MLVVPLSPAAAQVIPLDSPQTAASWQAAPSEGTDMRLSRENGALRIDFDFKGHGGYAVAHRAVSLELPPNYEIAFRIRAQAPVENLELKLIDTTGANVWWDNRRDFRFPAQWTTVRTKKRRISFAWGPAGGGELRRLGALELAVTAGSGGRGVVWIDSLRLRALPPEGPYTLKPAVSASSSAPVTMPGAVLDGDSVTVWRSAGGGEQWLALDFLRERELGGLRLDWGGAAATAYDVQLSDDGRAWMTAYRVTDGNGGRDYVFLPETDTRWLRLRLHGAGAAGAYELRELRVEPLAFGATRDSMFSVIARESPRGRYPRAYLGRQTYWTIVGVPGTGREALLDEDGRLEPVRGGPSIEPFVFTDGRLLTWADGGGVPSLARGDLPLPSVRRSAGGLALTVSAFATANPGGAPDLWARYRIENAGATRRRATLYLAPRPFQVNPPWQFLATQGGAATVASIRFDSGRVMLAGADTVAILPQTAPQAVGAASFDAGDITDYLAEGRLPSGRDVRDAHELASGALAYTLELAPGGSAEVCLRIPLGGGGATPAAPALPGGGACAGAAAAAERAWATLLDRTAIELGGRRGTEVARALRTNLAYILLNRDGPALRPGSRSYARSWVRDGALMAEALLRLGHTTEVRDYIRWYAPYQFPSGMVPCCVDARGADPVPENDSDGELIFLVAEYFRFTGDTALVREQWPRVAAAATHIDTLRQRRLTPEYASGPKRLFHGLLPESISHEGYSAKPMHSYWDDMWAVRGLSDAAFLAGVLGRRPEATTLTADGVALAGDLVASMQASMTQHGIDYLPGSAELGDFDATSTAIALSPLDLLLPRSTMRATFERYWRDFTTRRDGTRAWENYTPYEWRVLGALVRLGWPARADSALRFFMADRRPPAWNEWAEVVWRDPAAPRFIGDMPHTWVAAEFVRSVLELLAYERGAALVVGAGVPADWLAGEGVVVRGLRTRFGSLDLTMRRTGDRTRVRLAGDVRVPPGGIVLALPGPMGAVSVNGRQLPRAAGIPPIRVLPAEIEIREP